MDENPTGSLTTSSQVSSAEIARAFVDGAYSTIGTFNDGGGGWGGNNASVTEFMTGKADGNSQTEAFKFYDLEYDARAFYIDNWWAGMYSGIARANLAIQKIGEIGTLPAATKTSMIAEAKTMRALYYFQLVRRYGDVPKLTTLVESLDDIQTPRSPAKEIYDEIIIPDLLEAEKATLEWRDVSGRVSMGAVKALLADVYLTYAGFPVKAGDQFYAESAKRSKELIDNGSYTLFTEYTDMIDPANRNTKEFIFQVQHEKDIRHNGMTPVTLPTLRGIAAYSDEYGGLTPRKEFVESFAAGDKRREEKQFFYTFYKGHPSDYPDGDPRRIKLDLGGYYIYKWFDKQAIDNDAKSNLNYTIYRYADVLLMYAEASNRAEGKPNAQAMKALNDVRSRAKLPAVTTVNVNEFEEAVWAERYFELCFEGKMWFDIIRTRKVRNDITKKWDNFVGHTTIYGKTFSEKNLLFPIPKREIDNNSKLVQNTGF
ncbi:RagB/SusD family nutrient uptake outer membrane protein [Dyadobacter sp. NIV53]|uniref:RagB/SusD family nutrient uptake outer membrane protein n=1 Tax=Dyadobacter sp. NIV53 TaxID=2861765 RepID=UPI001E42ADEF|nr:RagB/SusD family nutrient uptake outer membrane protein [Dyadobacter sp. NIV53]